MHFLVQCLCVGKPHNVQPMIASCLIQNFSGVPRPHFLFFNELIKMCFLSICPLPEVVAELPGEHIDDIPFHRQGGIWLWPSQWYSQVASPFAQRKGRAETYHSDPLSRQCTCQFCADREEKSTFYMAIQHSANKVSTVFCLYICNELKHYIDTVRRLHPEYCPWNFSPLRCKESINNM